MMYSIGEFSLAARLTVKALRFYHEEGLLVPDYIDEESGYRYYREASLEKARAIALLREWDFPIGGMKEIFGSCTEDDQLAPFLVAQREKISEKIKKYGRIGESIDLLLSDIRRNEMEKNVNALIEEKTVGDMIFAGLRFRGKYAEVGRVFRSAARSAGRKIAGPAMSLYFECEYKEDNADIEAGFPVSKSMEGKEVSSRIVKGGIAVTIRHEGSYETIGRSYEKLFNYIETKKYEIDLPLREIYLKGPGMIFRGNPDRYVTEIQALIKKA